jgi:hypothetical protein
MNEEQLTEKISLWLDDELSPAEITELQTHLANDPASRQTLEAMQHVDRLLHAAATQMVLPSSGFTQRFEVRLAHYRPPKPWQTWLAMAALLGGTVSLFTIWAVVSGIALLSISTTVLDARIIYQGLTTFIESVNHLEGYLNLGALLLKTSFITMQQPLFWVCLLIAISLIGFWVWIMRMLSQRTVIPPQLIL